MLYTENLPEETYDRFDNTTFEDEFNSMIFKEQVHRYMDFKTMETNAKFEKIR
jgi:hypothetical protein